MSETPVGLVEHCKSKLRTLYVYEAKGEVLTQAILNRLAQENPGTYTSIYRVKAAKYIDQRCTDCSGLINWYTGILRGSYNCHDTAVERIGVDRLDEFMVGWVLWEPGHTRVYIGDGQHIEAKGINYGTIEFRAATIPWQKVFKLYDTGYTLIPVTYTQGFWPVADGQRWWYQFTDDSYTVNGWHWLREATDDTCGWYLFDSEGYILTDYQMDPTGEAFLLCPVRGSDEGKCMITNVRGALRTAEEYDMANRRYVLNW